MTFSPKSPQEPVVKGTVHIALDVSDVGRFSRLLFLEGRDGGHFETDGIGKREAILCFWVGKKPAGEREFKEFEIIILDLCSAVTTLCVLYLEW